MAVCTIRDALEGENPLCQRESFDTKRKLIREMNNGRAAVIHVLARSMSEDGPLDYLTGEGINDGALMACEEMLESMARVFNELDESGCRANALEALEELKAFNESPDKIAEREQMREAAVERQRMCSRILSLALNGATQDEILEKVEGSSKTLIKSLTNF